MWIFDSVVLDVTLCFYSFTCSGTSDVNLNIVPRGHLQPLGSHREPENSHIVDELDYMPSAEEFWRKYVKPSRAAVLRGAAKHAKAFTHWTEEYLKEHFGDLEVRVEAKGEKSGKIPIGIKGVGRDTIG